MTELGALQCLGEEITLLYIMNYYGEEVLTLNSLYSIDQESE